MCTGEKQLNLPSIIGVRGWCGLSGRLERRGWLAAGHLVSIYILRTPVSLSYLEVTP